MADDIAFLTATRLIELYRARELSPVEVVGETLRRLEASEAALNAFVLYDPETALEMARASEARWRQGTPMGLLDGLPVAIKDTVLTRAGRASSARARSTPTRTGRRTPRSRPGCASREPFSSARRRPLNSAGRG